MKFEETAPVRGSLATRYSVKYDDGVFVGYIHWIMHQGKFMFEIEGGKVLDMAQLMEVATFMVQATWKEG